MILHVDTYIGTRSSQQRGLFFKGKKNNDMSADVRGRVKTSTCIEPNEVIATIPLASLYTAENIRHRPHALPDVTVEDVRNAIPDDEFKLMAPQYYMGLQMSAILNELPDISRAHDVEKLNSISEELRTGVFPWARMLDDEDFNEEFVSGMYSMALDSWQRTSFNEMTTKFHRGLSAIHSRLHPPFKVDHFRRITRLVLARAEHLPPLDYYDGSLWLRRMRRSVRRLRRQPDPSVLALVPYLDLINHSNRPNCGIQIGPSRHLNGKGAITIHALARIEPGREICRHYNFALSRPNALFRYGFLPFDLISIVEQNAVNEHLEKERHMFAPPGEAAVEAFRREEEQLENLEKLFKAQPTSKAVDVVSVELLVIMEPSVKESVKRIPLLKTKAGPRDGDQWTQRLKEEYASLITYVENNKANDAHWFQLESNPQGTRWYGTCWTFYKSEKYVFEVNFDIPVTYPQAPPEIALPELEGKTVKMYRGGKICMTTHFFPLWTRNVPYFGISHALALGLGPWLSIEVPAMVEEGFLKPEQAA